MKTKDSVISILLASLLCICAIACSTDTKNPVTVNVDKNIVVTIYSIDDSGDTLRIVSPCLLEESVHISELRLYPGDKDVTMPFNFSDTAKYAEITENNLGKRIAISINGQIVSTPVVKMKIEKGACSVVLDETQIKALFNNINIEDLKSGLLLSIDRFPLLVVWRNCFPLSVYQKL